MWNAEGERSADAKLSTPFFSPLNPSERFTEIQHEKEYSNEPTPSMEPKCETSSLENRNAAVVQILSTE